MQLMEHDRLEIFRYQAVMLTAERGAERALVCLRDSDKASLAWATSVYGRS